jgi:hypothetical protein
MSQKSSGESITLSGSGNYHKQAAPKTSRKTVLHPMMLRILLRRVERIDRHG